MKLHIGPSEPFHVAGQRRRSHRNLQRLDCPDILFQTKDAARFGKLTTDNLQKPLGIFLDHHYLSAPIVQSPIYDSGQITGQFTQEATVTLANELNAGALPVSVKIVEKETIGPTLGKLDLVQSMRAAALGLVLVLIFMIVVYRLPGFLADVALAIYVLVRPHVVL